jgi:ABC-type iron transport system FetAB permease component
MEKQCIMLHFILKYMNKIKKKKVFLDLVRINLDIAYFFYIKNTKNMMVKYVKNAWIKI